MDISIIERPDNNDVKPIEDAVIKYGLSQVGGEAPRKWAFHVMESKELVGGATGRDHFSQFYLDTIWVKEDYRCKGIGSRIHDEVVACAKRCDCKRIVLSTLNKQAVRFYRRLGYVQLAMIEAYVDGFDLYYMAKRIDAT